jgi:hypothetical protein
MGAGSTWSAGSANYQITNLAPQAGSKNELSGTWRYMGGSFSNYNFNGSGGYIGSTFVRIA